MVPVCEIHNVPKKLVGKSKTYYHCTPCKTEYSRKWRAKNPEKNKELNQQYLERLRKEKPNYYKDRYSPAYAKDKQLKYLFGITLNDYNEMLKNQEFKCKVCGKEENVIHHRTGKSKDLSVDHCHETGKVRGLLCQRCNLALGMVKDDTNLLGLLTNYLNYKGE